MSAGQTPGIETPGIETPGIETPGIETPGAPRPPALADLAVGDTLPPHRIAVDRARLVHYAGASGDRNPIHWDEHFAAGVGLPDVIAHGMFTMGAAVEAVAAWCGDPGRIVEYGTKFVGMVPVPRDAGASVDVLGTVKKVDAQAGRVTVELAVTCAGTKVLGRALVVVDLGDR